MAALLAIVLLFSLPILDRRTGVAKKTAKFSQLFSKSPAINRLSVARFFLFGSRDIWFVVALPVFLQFELGWSYVQVGSLLASWIIGYGIVQTLAPRVTTASGRSAFHWVAAICLVPALIALGLHQGWHIEPLVIVGLLVFGLLFAVNSSLHSYLIVSYARADGASLDVGFYYMANAAGRLVCTVLSGLIYQQYGLAACMIGSSLLLVAAAAISWKLPR